MNFNKLVFTLIILICLLVISGCNSNQQTAKSGAEAFTEWAKENVSPVKTIEPGSGFDDLRPLGSIIGDAEVVCLGESRHDVHEYFRLKHRIVEYLVEEKGFTLFAMEEGMPYAEKINEYISGGEGNPENLLSKTGNWFIWDTEEILELIKWMRNYNDNPEHRRKIRFCGFDMTDPLPGIRNLLAYLDRADPVYAENLRKQDTGLDLFNANIWTEILNRYKALSAEKADELAGLYKNLINRFENKRPEYISKSTEAEYENIFRQLITVDQANEFFISGVKGTMDDAGDARERAMADNIKWLLNQKEKNERLIIWAHNFHVAKNFIDIYPPNQPPSKGMKPMIQILNEDINKKPFSVGFCFNRSDYPDRQIPPAEDDMLDAALARVNVPVFLLDLRSAAKNEPVYNWLFQKQSMRGQGGTAELFPGKTYDALIFVEKITKAVSSQRARTRFNNLRRE